MPRIKVTRLRKFCGQLAGHSWRQAERVAQAAKQLFHPPSKSLAEDPGDITLLDLQLFIAERLEEERRSLTEVDNQHNHELQIDRNLRQERDAATAQLREKLLQLRDSLDGLFGPGGSAKIFEDSTRIPVDPMALAQFAGHVVANLADEEFPMPTPLQKGFTLDRRETVRDLEGPYRQLDTVLRQLESTESDSKYSQTRKDVKVDVTETFAFKVARFYEALYDLIGLDGLSDRVRRSSHRATSSGAVELPEITGDDASVDGDDATVEPASEPPIAAATTGG